MINIRKGKTNSSNLKRENRRLSIFMLTPITLILLAVSVYPLIKSFDISLRYYNLTKLGKGTPYIGFENYRFILTDPKFWQSVRVTIVFVVV